MPETAVIAVDVDPMWTSLTQRSSKRGNDQTISTLHATVCAEGRTRGGEHGGLFPLNRRTTSIFICHV